MYQSDETEVREVGTQLLAQLQFVDVESTTENRQWQKGTVAMIR